MKFIYVFILEETGPITDELVLACLSTPNPAAGDFHRVFCNDVVRLMETSNIHKHSTTCYKYSKGTFGTLKTCRMCIPRALVKISNIDLSTDQITMRRSHPWINTSINGSLVLVDPTWILNSFGVTMMLRL
ncbi:unnamed protein product [Rotaria magnacalcarata]|uniref:Uncharacterized protein n=1 Tax=Rotaria magnacalcarata TaxID=392030 RepID=A0A816VTW1_9BILA|nr:unnamed protein product [Rotaria magnacalcarata]CAF2127172.1 unnamed protein product [Rotaria magnacalcarata]